MKTTYFDHGDEGVVIAREQDVGGIVESIKELRAAGSKDFAGMRHVARVPEVVVEHYCNVHGVSYKEFCRNPEHMRRLIADPAFSDLRVHPGGF